VNYLKYVYAALLLHAAGKEINEESLTKILDVTGGQIEKPRIQALVAALSEVDIDEALKTAPGLAVPAVPLSEPATEEEKEEKEEEEKEEKEEEALAGLGALFQ
jgi:large subunit ribosomal protein L12